MRAWRLISLLLAFGATITIASANPVNNDPSGQILSYVFALIAVVCIAIETSIIRILCRALHDADCDLPMTALVVFLNVLTLAIIVIPLYRLTESILVSEAAVVFVEAVGIWRILSFGGVNLTFRRAALYSLVVNLVSWGIGYVVQ